MLSKQKSWLSSQSWKPKNFHSLEHLKYLHTFLTKNPQVTEQNRDALVEALRSISEILIWGDQNDNAVFDFFLEKNMLSYFLFFMRQKSGSQLCVQLLQTLNILFENISNQTSLYYLLSNNHVNSIIEHKFDFSDEEVMAYYISFLKTLSFKLNKHTIHFFYNEHANDFALYTEAIKFFNHSESMVRIAVRTITLNVFRVEDEAMLRFICERTAGPYFCSLVWSIGSHVLEMDACERNDIDHNSRDRLADLVAEHLDHLHYLNDVLCLGIGALNDVLSEQLLDRLLLPLYVHSLVKRSEYTPRADDLPHVNSVVALFLLSQVFLIISHAPLVRLLADIILKGDSSACITDNANSDTTASANSNPKARSRGFRKPEASLAEALDSAKSNPQTWVHLHSLEAGGEEPRTAQAQPVECAEPQTAAEGDAMKDVAFPEASDVGPSGEEGAAYAQFIGQNSTDEEKLLQNLSSSSSSFNLKERPYLEAVFAALDVSDSDYEVLFGLCLLYALGHNPGINQALLDTIQFTTYKSLTKDKYNMLLVDKIMDILILSCEAGSKVRLATMELAVLMVKMLVMQEGRCYLLDRHLAAAESAREEATLQLRNFYKSEEIFLDMFEDEYRDMKSRPLNVEHLMMDASVLLPPTGTPLTGIDFVRRLPCGEVERARKAIRVFFMLRDLSLTLRQEVERDLPLTKDDECVRHGDVLDLNNSDLIACSLVYKDNRKERRFLVIDILQLILVEPDSKKLGWGIVKFVGLLQDAEVTGDKEDSRSLHVTVHKPSMRAHVRPLPLLLARFIFDDHIRCMAAKQRLTKGRLKARQLKMHMIARLLDLPSTLTDSAPNASSPQQPHLPPAKTRASAAQPATIPGRSQPMTVRRSSGPKSSTEVGSKSPAGAMTDKAAVMRRAQAARAARHKQRLTSPLSSDAVTSVGSDSMSTAGSLGSMSSSSQSSSGGVPSGIEVDITVSQATEERDNDAAYTINSDPALPVGSPLVAEVTTANSSAVSVAVDALQELSLSSRADSECGEDSRAPDSGLKGEGHVMEGYEPSASSSTTSDSPLLGSDAQGGTEHIVANPATQALEKLSRLACD